MRWLIFAIFVYLAFALDIGLRTMPIWSIQTSVGPVSPDLVLMLAIYFGLWAPPRTAAWVMLILGLLVDLTTQHYTSAAMNPALAGPHVVAIVGPNALGYLAGAYAVVQFRGLLYRESAVSVAIMVFAVGVMVNLVTLLLLTVRGLPWLLGNPSPIGVLPSNWSTISRFCSIRPWWQRR